MTLLIEKMDLSLIGLNNSNEYNPKNELQKSRVLAQVLGPNQQDAVFQAVQGRTTEIEKLLELSNQITGNPEKSYLLLSWIALNIGRGDPNCANYMNWAGLLVMGNFEEIKKAWPLLEKKITAYVPEKEAVHPELQEVLDNHPGSTHFTSIRIPEIKFINQALHFNWPKQDLTLKGTPLKELSLK